MITRATTGTDLTCRIVAHVSLSGSQVRFRLINYPSTTPVTFSHLVAAVRTTGLDVDPGTQRVVTVHGATPVTLPANGDVTTDPVSLPVKRGQDVTLSIALGRGESRRPGTTGARRPAAALPPAPAT